MFLTRDEIRAFREQTPELFIDRFRQDVSYVLEAPDHISPWSVRVFARGLGFNVSLHNRWAIVSADCMTLRSVGGYLNLMADIELYKHFRAGIRIPRPAPRAEGRSAERRRPPAYWTVVQ